MAGFVCWAQLVGPAPPGRPAKKLLDLQIPNQSPKCLFCHSTSPTNQGSFNPFNYPPNLHYLPYTTLPYPTQRDESALRDLTMGPKWSLYLLTMLMVGMCVLDHGLLGWGVWLVRIALVGGNSFNRFVHVANDI